MESGPAFIEELKTVIRNDLIEDNEDNCNLVQYLYQDYLSEKITNQQFREATKTLLKQPNFFDKLDDTQYKPIPAAEAPAAVRRRQKSKQWTPEDDETLRQAIAEHGTNDWGAVAAKLGNTRTRSQCSQRWNRVLNPAINKSNWTPEEEAKLLQAVSLIGERSWTRVASQMGDRSDVQCRFKYFHLKKKNGKDDSSDAYHGAFEQQAEGSVQLPNADNANIQSSETTGLQIPALGKDV